MSECPGPSHISLLMKSVLKSCWHHVNTVQQLLKQSIISCTDYIPIHGQSICNLMFNCMESIYMSSCNVCTNYMCCLKQHTTMRSTMRRLGEDIFKGIVSKGNPHSSSEQPTESKSKSAAFFKSFCMPLRFLSTLIVLKTVKQGRSRFF